MSKSESGITSMKIKKNPDELIQEVNAVLSPDFDDIGKQYGTSVKDTKDLFCYGCAHSAGDSDFPGKPSGERPCFFCVRNEDREKWQEDHKKKYGKELREWYDNSPICFYPMDAYQTIDMEEQEERWERRAKGEEDWNSPKGGIRFG